MSCEYCNAYWHVKDLNTGTIKDYLPRLINFCPMCGKTIIPPTPIPLKQLRQMVGTHVWLVDKCRDMPFSGWAVCDGAKVYYFWWSEHSPVGVASKDLEDKYDTDDYGQEWLVYTHKPKEAT